MTILDLTMDFHGERFPAEIKREEMPLQSGLTKYTGIIYTITHDGMSGTYIDFPGHIAETDDGVRTDTLPVEDVYRVPAQVLRMHRKSGSGAVTAADLEAAAGGKLTARNVILNALGDLEPNDIENRSVYLDDSALDWLIANGCKLLVSDIYESQALHGVFLKLFAAGVSTVCHPVHLGQIAAKEVKMTILFSKLPITQLPCRLIVEY
jgi:kynurenine formamidase